jgi:hypothetical protein
MPSPTKRTTKKAPALPENSTPSEIMAAGIITEFSDLAPSVNRIMNSGLEEDGRMVAIAAFKESLGMINDPMRNPANAIEAGRAVEAAAV